MNYLKYVKVWHQKKHHLTDAVDMSNLSSEDSDNDDSGVQADHERVGEFISFLEKYKAISKLQLNQFLISRLHRANLIW